MNDSPLCKRLKEARLAANFSQKKLGIEAGMDQFSASARMNHYEMGRHTPDYSTLKRIATVLNLPVAYFYAESDELAEFIKVFNRLKKEERINELWELMSKNF
ncbi:helix-turn-helix domain-containing protein [Legionella feeleii]|uniref:Helix-turn-helix domain n=1 Tax=Legionella feeleii TaxID=453 RepID=A0A0W0U8S2_9GAMM|nr:helix-turn-helix transcriptional regulator [Legionella feeleii]KTD04171.1 Helix-turn-helix domain protein [Legionella feeleii]SPX60717.1 Helix-turn-helix domain [Legionella feeleii]